MYDRNDLKQKEDYLRHLLRRHPEELDLKMHQGGWISTQSLLHACATNGKDISLADIIAVMTETKTEYSFSDSSYRFIRANYGHSLGLRLEEIVGPPSIPQDTLYHGTIHSELASILKHGILPKGRDHVFLTSSFNKACEYGMRRGLPAIVKIDTQIASTYSISFFHPCTHIWLAYHIPPFCISGIIEFQAEGYESL